MKRAFIQSRLCGKIAMMQVLLLVCAAFSAAAEGLDIKLLKQKLESRLATAPTPADSIPLLYDLMDISTADESYPQHCQRLFDVATRADRHEVQLEALRRMAIYSSSKHKPEPVDLAAKLIERVPDSDDRKKTDVLISACKANITTFDSDRERDEFLRDHLKRYAELPPDTDPFERVRELFIIVPALAQFTRGQLLSEYLDALDEALTAMPRTPHLNYLRMYFNNHAATYYWQNYEIHKSINADRRLLIENDSRVKNYQDNGRFFANQDLDKYTSLRRLLRWYEYLMASDVSSYYNQLMELAERNPSIADDLKRRPAPMIGMLVKKGHYKQALELIKPLAESASTIAERRLRYSQLLDIARKSGDEQVIQDAEADNNRISDLYFNHYKARERVAELQLLYDINAARRAQAAQRLAKEHRRTVALYSAGAFILLLMIAFAALYLQMRRRYLQLDTEATALRARAAEAAKLKEELDEVRARANRCETEKMRLSTYIGHEMMAPLNIIIDYSQMIAESTEDAVEPYVRRFASIVEVNSRILQEIAADMQDFSINETHKVAVHPVPVNINALSEITADSIKSQLPPLIGIAFEQYCGQNRIITTDPRRLQMSMLFCMGNMLKLPASGGELVVAPCIDSDSQSCTIVFTHTGAEIPDSARSEIFANWTAIGETDDPTAGNMNLAAIGATLSLDPSYQGPGVRIRLTLPVNKYSEQ